MTQGSEEQSGQPSLHHVWVAKDSFFKSAAMILVVVLVAIFTCAWRCGQAHPLCLWWLVVCTSGRQRSAGAAFVPGDMQLQLWQFGHCDVKSKENAWQVKSFGMDRG